jgi:hypothetical protein
MAASARSSASVPFVADPPHELARLGFGVVVVLVMMVS